MVPMTLLGAGQTADYVITGEWAKKALVEGKRVGPTHVAATTEGEQFRRVPRNDELHLSEQSAFVHTTSNNTIWGTQWQWEPETVGRPLVCDMSSDFLSRPIDAARYAVIYAGAQKNAGPAGVTVVILKDEVLSLGPADKRHLPIMMNYRTHVEGKSLYNTPPVFPIYIVHLVLRWLKQRGGLLAMARHNQEKAAHIYRVLDEMPAFYRAHAHKDSRSLMNVTFRLPTEALDERFVKDARAEGMDGLKGHRTAGGIRASLYNALPMAAAEALASFMREFARKHG
jgi:phosphoserine aminotransferase